MTSPRLTPSHAMASSPHLPKLPSAHRSNSSPRAKFHTHNELCSYTHEQLKTMDPEDRFISFTIDQTNQETTTDSIIHLINTLYWPFIQCDDASLNQSPLAASDVKIVPVSGGITNSLYRVHILKHPSSQSTDQSTDQSGYGHLLIRTYGLNTEAVIDRNTECHLVNILSKADRSVKMYGGCLNGRIEQWLDASPLTPLNMKVPHISAMIASTLAQMHSIDQSTLSFLDHPSMGSVSVTPYHRILPQWADFACSDRLNFHDQPTKQASFESIDPHFWRRELTESLELFNNSSLKDQQLVFSHGDLLSGNILRPNNQPIDQPCQSGRLYLIDFEYASFHYSGYDIANHFCENCGFEMIWSQFPDETFQRNFIRSYLTEMKAFQLKQSSWRNTQPLDQSINQSNNQTNSDCSVSEAEVDQVYLEVEAHLIFSHLFWGIWALLQARYSAIDFDYMGYSALRKEGYLRVKERSWQVLRQLAK